MKILHKNSHFWGTAVHRWIGLTLGICFFISGLANAMHCDDALFRLKSCGISKAQLSRTGGANKIKADHPIVAATESHTFDKIYLPSAMSGYHGQTPFIASIQINPLCNKAPPSLS